MQLLVRIKIARWWKKKLISCDEVNPHSQQPSQFEDTNSKIASIFKFTRISAFFLFFPCYTGFSAREKNETMQIDVTIGILVHDDPASLETLIVTSLQFFNLL